MKCLLGECWNLKDKRKFPVIESLSKWRVLWFFSEETKTIWIIRSSVSSSLRNSLGEKISSYLALYVHKYGLRSYELSKLPKFSAFEYLLDFSVSTFQWIRGPRRIGWAASRCYCSAAISLPPLFYSSLKLEMYSSLASVSCRIRLHSIIRGSYFRR